MRVVWSLQKDLRPWLTSDTQDEVLDGDLDGFMEASLAHRVNGGATSVVEDVE